MCKARRLFVSSVKSTALSPSRFLYKIPLLLSLLLDLVISRFWFGRQTKKGGGCFLSSPNPVATRPKTKPAKMTMHGSRDTTTLGPGHGVTSLCTCQHGSKVVETPFPQSDFR
ncbi:hypothetical protein ml_152 [Mollivirus sibericum]|uniref:hypothetical protein n=1 Tax=Mollivirus sibericum TaxID=1678078 RepID=UPI0006B2EE1C|nr:hypothetical protein ml_152 [Mollivirus sibericum]ALD61954.1 hypothetical protein ml_152 [Mollivirus sibericum]